MRVLVFAAGAVLAAGCLRATSYECSGNADCVLGDVRGYCEPADGGHSFCAFADDGCAPSRMRFGDAAGDADGTCAGGVTPAGRGPDVCLPGARFPPTFSACTQDVCEYLPSCCASSWTAACVSAAEVRCATACGRQLAFAGKGVVDVVADDDGDGTFTVVASTGTAGHPYAEVAWADLDGDARPELVIATADLNAAGDEQRIDRFDGQAFTAGLDLRTLDPGGSGPWSSYSALALSVGDFDGDGWADLAFMGAYPTFQIAHNRRALAFDLGPAGSQGPPDLVNVIAAGGGWIDIDGDGDDDLVVAIADHVWTLISDRQGLLPTNDVPLPGIPRWAGWADVDGDGRFDLAIAGDGFARVFRNAGTGLDPTPVFASDGRQLVAGAWIDADGDGDPDLALAEQSGKLRVYFDEGGALETIARWTSLEDQDSRGMVAADVDGDRDLDLVVANLAPHPSRIYLNGGDRTFTPGGLTLPAQSFEGVSATARTR